MVERKTKKNSEIAEKIIKTVNKEEKGGECKICKKEYKNLEQHYKTEFHKRRMITTKTKKINFKSTNKYQAGLCPVCNIVVSNLSDHKKNKHTNVEKKNP